MEHVEAKPLVAFSFLDRLFKQGPGWMVGGSWDERHAQMKRSMCYWHRTGGCTACLPVALGLGVAKKCVQGV